MRWAPIIGGGVVLLAVGLTAAQRTPGWENPLWERAEAALLDTWFVLRGEQPSRDEVVIVGIDDRTLATHPEVLERRAGGAELLRALWKADASAVAIDLVFETDEQLLTPGLQADVHAWVAQPEPDTPPGARDLLQRAADETRGDDLLEAAMREGETILGFHIGHRASTEGTPKLTRGTFGQVVPGDHMPPAMGEGVLASLPRFNKAARRLGVFTAQQRHGRIPSSKLVYRVGPRHFLPLGMQLAASRLGVKRGKLVYRGDEGAALIGDLRVQGDDNRIWLNWRGKSSFERVSAADVLEGEVDFDGRLALVGFAHLAHDRFQTPWGLDYGVVLHATLMDNLLAGDPMTRASMAEEVGFVGLCGGLLLLGFLVPGRGTRLVGAFLAAGVALGGPPALFLWKTHWLGSVGAMGAVGFGTLGAFTVAWFEEGRQARALRTAFAHYVSDDLLQVMVADPSLVQLRGQRRDLSVLFSDIRDFTTYSERIEPLELIGFLNHYLTPMTRAVLDNRGFVDKFIGDAVMALFGAPVADEKHAEAACRAALDMFVALDGVRPEAQRHGIDLAIGVGVNSGEVAVGNMGSKDRLEYTVLGDAVNLAARLEGLTKTYGVFCLVGPNTVSGLPAGFRVRRLDLVRVKGKEEPVEIFELCGDERVTVVEHQLLDRWEEAVDAWRAGDLETARAAFQAFVEANAHDKVGGLYLDRLAAMDGVPDGWDGVFVHRTKG